MDIKLNNGRNRYEFICDRIRELMGNNYSLKLVKEYVDAVIAICVPSDFHMLDEVFLIPQNYFEPPFLYSKVECEKFEVSPVLNNLGNWQRELPEKYRGKPIVSFYISEVNKRN